MDSTGVRSKGVAMLFLINCLLLLPLFVGFGVGSCFAVSCVPSSFVMTSLRKRELVTIQ